MEQPFRLLCRMKRKWRRRRNNKRRKKKNRRWKRKDARRREARVRQGEDRAVHPTAAPPGVKLLTDGTGVRQSAGPSGK